MGLECKEEEEILTFRREELLKGLRVAGYSDQDASAFAEKFIGFLGGGDFWNVSTLSDGCRLEILGTRGAEGQIQEKITIGVHSINSEFPIYFSVSDLEGLRAHFVFSKSGITGVLREERGYTNVQGKPVSLDTLALRTGGGSEISLGRISPQAPTNIVINCTMA